MKLMIDPMPGLKAAKASNVNRNFNSVAMGDFQRDSAHSQKRLWATTNDQRLAPEATLRGITVEQLAAIILSKPDNAAQRELQRQKILKRIDDAKTPKELDAI